MMFSTTATLRVVCDDKKVLLMVCEFGFTVSLKG